MQKTKLKAKIIETYGNLGAFAQAMGISQPRLSELLSIDGRWPHKRVMQASSMLKIRREEIGDYFYPEVGNENDT